jgi:hypothetical protein
MENLGVFHDHLVYFTAIGNILWPFGKFFVVFFPVLVFWAKKNLATMFYIRRRANRGVKTLPSGLRTRQRSRASLNESAFC